MIGKDFFQSWNMFWFLPRSALTLAWIRISTGSMLAYIHVVWSMRLADFMGAKAFTTKEWVRSLHRQDYTWSYLWFIDSMPFLWAHEVIAIVLAILMAIGLFTRYVIPLIWFMTLMVCHRMTGFLFGLDQIVMMLTTYLMIAQSGEALSVDRALRFRRNASEDTTSQTLVPLPLSPWNTISTRLMQIHLCIIYLFGGLGKMRGETWWDGSAIWLSAVSYEYQSIDFTWIGHAPALMALAAHVTLFWETFYCCLVWPKLTRPWILVIAVGVHAGIGIFLGMITFGWMMIVANFAFIRPETSEQWIATIQRYTRSSR